MTQRVELGKSLDHPVGHTQFAKDWWNSDAFRLLPGETDDYTVFVIDFYDRCKYFGYTKDPVLARTASLAANIGSWQTNTFVEEHAARVPYAIHCIKSGLNDLQARRLRDTLVTQAPENILTSRGSVVQTHKCWLSNHEDSDPPMPAL